MYLKFLTAAIVAIVAIPSSAQASEAEKIILHCASLPNDEVRLACFDAVVSLTSPQLAVETRPSSATTPAIQVSEDVFAGVAQGAVQTHSDFSGPYLGGGVSAGTGPGLNLGGDGSGSSPFLHSSPAWTTFAGYNWISESGYLLGVEASASGDMYSESIYTRGYERFQETLAPTLSARLGIQVQELLLFARAGVGASFLTSTDSREPEFDEHYVFPAAAVAMGAEVNFDNIFLRAEGELRQVWAEKSETVETFDTNDTLTTYRAGVGLGMRF